MEKFQNFLGSLKQPFLNTADFILGGEGFISGKETPSTLLFQDLVNKTEPLTTEEQAKNFLNPFKVKRTDKFEKEIEKNKNKDNTIDEDKYLKQNQELLKDIAKLGEEARGRDFVREGIRTLANAPLIGAQAQLAAAEGINRLTIGNMGAMAAQNRVLEANPPKQKIAGRYFR